MASIQKKIYPEYKELLAQRDVFLSAYNRAKPFNFLFKKLSALIRFESLMNVITKYIILIIFISLIIINYIDDILLYIPIDSLIKQTISSNKPTFRSFVGPAFLYLHKKLVSRHRKKLALEAYFKFQDVIVENLFLLADSLITKLDFKNQLNLQISNLKRSLLFINTEHADMRSYAILQEFIEKLCTAQELDFDNPNSLKSFTDLFAENILGSIMLPLPSSRFQKFYIIERAIRKL